MTTEQTMLARCARAACRRLGRDPDFVPEIAVPVLHGRGQGSGMYGPAPSTMEVKKGPALWEQYEPIARAVIEELMKPTDAMVEAGGASLYDIDTAEYLAEKAYLAMLQSILNQDKQGEGK